MNTLILSGFGTNCEKETVYACERGGAPPGSVSVRHINDIYAGELDLRDYRFLILIGGFLDGDDLGGARACANRFRYRPLPGGGTFLESLRGFVGENRLVLGVCNGFQLLVRLGLLPGEETGEDAGKDAGKDARRAGPQRITLTTNANGRFEDRWVRLRSDPSSPCVFTRGLSEMELPVRHGEGRLIGENGGALAALVEKKLVPFRYSDEHGAPTEAYPDNPNGTPFGVAALCNPAGTVMGLMPHPEAFNHYTNHPHWTRRPRRSSAGEDGDGIVLFRNAYDYLKGRGKAG